MHPPLTSISWIDWAVWADWTADYRPKAEPFARKVVRSLRKMEAVGCDPRMCLSYKGIEGYSILDLSRGHSRGNYCVRPVWGSVLLLRLSEVHWDTEDFPDYHYSPADLPAHWQQTRLTWKFWKCVNRRALGIKDSVLEGLL